MRPPYKSIISYQLAVIAIRQLRKVKTLLRLIPVCDRRDIILKREVPRFFPRLRAPTERLNRHSQVGIESNRVGNMPAVHRKPMLRKVLRIGLCRIKAGIRGRKILVLPMHRKAHRSAEIVLYTRAADSRYSSSPSIKNFISPSPHQRELFEPQNRCVPT